MKKTAWMTAHLLITWFTEYFRPTVETYFSEKKNPFNIVLFIDNAPGHQELVKMDNEVNVAFMPADIASILQPMEERVILTSKFLLFKKFIS